MIATENERLLNLFQHKMREELGHHLKEIILFGSRARGDFSLDSDYDCLLVLDELPPETEHIISDVTGELLYQHDAIFSVFPVLEENYRHQKFDPFLMNIRKEGISLWTNKTN